MVSRPIRSQDPLRPGMELDAPPGFVAATYFFRDATTAIDEECPLVLSPLTQEAIQPLMINKEAATSIAHAINGIGNSMAQKAAANVKSRGRSEFDLTLVIQQGPAEFLSKQLRMVISVYQKPDGTEIDGSAIAMWLRGEFA